MMADYDLRSNIKGKPNAQGTLFRAPKDLLNPAQRWPRGYTPERQRAVDAALPEEVVGSTSWKPGYGPRYEPYHQMRDKVRQAVARSSVSTQDLTGLRSIDSKPLHGHAATYWPEQQKIGWGLDYQSRNANLIHEIGHHVSFRSKEGLRAAHEHAANLIDSLANTEIVKESVRIRPHVEEAIADDYAERHFRSDRREKTDVAAPYDARFSQGDLDEHRPGYTMHRPPKTQPLGVQFDAHRQGELF
jgi:hypothetical protein